MRGSQRCAQHGSLAMHPHCFAQSTHLCHALSSQLQPPSRPHLSFSTWQTVSAFAGLAPANDEGLVVLAGDPQQLGPVVRSPLARELGLGESLLERLMNDQVFSRKEDGAYDERVLTKLLKNYRCLTLPRQSWRCWRGMDNDGQ